MYISICGQELEIAVCRRFCFLRILRDRLSGQEYSESHMSMNAMHKLLLLGLWLISSASWAQHSSPPGAADASPRAITDLDVSKTPLKTDDGVAACPVELKSDAAPDRVYRVGGGVLPPKPIETPEATFSDEELKLMGKKHAKQYEAIVRFTVDANGVPQDICVARGAGHGLDPKVVEAVTKYRFKAATLDGKPVPVRLTVAMDFRFYR
jgi:TonB family protein